jgi:hypothetical protein
MRCRAALCLWPQLCVAVMEMVLADYAFVIGLENYILDGLRKVQFAENDGQAVANALRELGFIVDTILLSKDATKTTVEHRLRELFAALKSDDRLLFYYAGHGWAIPGHTILTCADSNRRDLDGTGIRLSWIMERLEESDCSRAMFFLDACHSGAVDLKSDRDVVDDMDEKEIEKFFAEAEHKVCFAACKFSQKSISTPMLKHGVWTHQLLRALRGEERKALSKGKYLTARSLQDFLATTVPIAAKAARSDQPKQTPVMYGSLTSDFEVADLTALISAKAAAGAVNPSYKSAVYSFTESVPVRSLSGFKSHHKVPKEASDYHSNWVSSIADEDVKDRVNKRFQEVKTALGLKRKEIEAVDGRIITKDFEYAIWCEQDSDSPSHAVFKEELSDVTPEYLFDADFNEIFDRTFDEMVLSPKKAIDVEGLIDAIEELDDPRLSVDYEPDVSGCTVTVREAKVTLYVDAHRVRVGTRSKMSPEQLVNVLEQARKEMIELAGPTVRLLG